MRFTYTATRSIASGHSAGNAYTLAILPQSITPKDDSNRVQQIANDGTEENLLFRIDEIYSVATDWIVSPTPLDQWKEFLRSVAGGEAFTFDETGYAADVNPRPCKLVPGSIVYTRVAAGYAAYTVSFAVRMTDALI